MIIFIAAAMTKKNKLKKLIVVLAISFFPSIFVMIMITIKIIHWDNDKFL
jgi:hypothetical protein